MSSPTEKYFAFYETSNIWQYNINILTNAKDPIGSSLFSENDWIFQRTYLGHAENTTGAGKSYSGQKLKLASKA
jgi:hypothetical protein